MMSRAAFWYRIAGFAGWTLLIWGALKSEPLWQRLLGDQYSVTQKWCGAWGCSATMPKLLAWQLPAVLLLVPVAWLLARTVPAVHRHGRLLGAIVFALTLAWMIAQTVQASSLGQIHSVEDVGRHLVFTSVAGASVVIPLMLVAITLAVARSRDLELRANADGGTTAQKSKDFGDVVIPHVDTAT